MLDEEPFRIVFEWEAGGWVVHVPGLNGITTEGDSLAEAVEMLKELVKGYVEVTQELGGEMPPADELRPILDSIGVLVEAHS